MQPDARTVLDVNHKVHWGWKISAYLVTKGIAAGAAMLAPFLSMLGAPDATFAPEVIALVFASLTSVLLVIDLKRPAKFLSILLRPNTKSWIVRGSWILIGFSTVTAAILGARWLGMDALADGLRWPNLLLGAATAGYTAFLFGQCEGRDLWQSKLLLPHLLAQALMLGGAVLLITTPTVGIAFAALIGVAIHVLLAMTEANGSHDTDNAKQAAALLPRIPMWPGSPLKAFREGLTVSFLAALMPVVLIGLGMLATPAAVALAIAALAGAFWYEQAFVRAGQIPPLH